MRHQAIARILTCAVALLGLFGGAGHAQTTFNAANGALTFPACNGSNPCDVTSTITPTGLSGTISNITVTLNPAANFNQFQATIYILQAPGGAAMVLFGQACVGDLTSATSFTLSDAASSTALQGTSLNNCNTLTGSYKPGSFGVGTFAQSFVSSYNLPPHDGSATLLYTFGGLGGANLTGAWTLYAIEVSQDSVSGSLGTSLTPAWSMTITTAAAAGTTTSVASNDNPAFKNDVVTFTATVTSATSGTVTFLDGGTALTCSGGNQTVNSMGVATCSLSTLSEGAHSITASYGGTGSFGPSTSSPVLQVVNNRTVATPTPPVYKFCNPGSLTIPGSGASGDFSATGAPASPYASEIFASGVSGTIQDVQVLVNGFTSIDPQAVGLLLVGPNTKNLDFFSWAGGSSSVSGVNLTIDDLATGQVPQSASPSSTSYKPTSYTSGQPTVYCSNSAGCNNVIVSEPAPSSFMSAGPHGTATLLGQFGGISPNGTWQLFAVDRIGGETASIGSWCLNFTVSSGDATSTNVTSSTNPSYTTSPNNSVTFTATVTDTAHSGTQVNEGTVTFADGGANLSCSPAFVSGGTASCTTSFSTEGNHSITAAYSGTANFAESNGSLTQTVYNHTTVSLNSGVYSYCNAGPFDIPAGGANHNAGPSGPYPEDIFVSGLPGTINKVTVSLSGYESNAPGDIDMMLVGPCQTNGCTPTAANGIDFFSRAGDDTPVTGLNFTIDDSGPSLSNTTLMTGTFKPTSEPGTSTYGAPAPSGPYQYAAPQGSSTFSDVFTNGQNGNGTWSLYGESTLEGAYVTLTGSPAFCVNITPNAPVLAITKTNNPSNFRQGDTGDTFAITVMNNGPGATGDPTGTNPVTVVDTLPTGLTATAISGTGWSCTLSSLTCTRSDALAASDSYDTITVTVTVAANAMTSVTNSAAVTGGGSSGTKTANDTVTVTQVADLTIAKSHTGPFVQGDTSAANDTYTITVSNAANVGPTVGTVTVVDTLPTGLTASSMSGMGWTCTTSTATCTRSDVLASGSSYPAISLVVTVASNAATGTNSVTVSGGGELNTANDTATDPTTITPLPDLTISKSHTGNFTQGQVGATYTIVAGNATGAANTTGTVTVVDTLPMGLTATAIAGTGWSCVLTTLTCSRSDALAGGSNYSAITLTVTVATNAPSSVTNMATVSGGGELNTANDMASDMTTVIQVPDLTISKSHSTQFVQGDTGDRYSIVVSNAGPGPVVAGNTVTVVDTLPSGLTATAISGSGWLCVTGTLTCTTTNALALNGMYQPITVTVNVSSTAPASVTNMATVSGGGELNTANDTASDITSITQVADLTVSKSHTGNFYQGQQGVTYTITVSNSGLGSTDGSQVLVSDTVPSGLTFVSMSGSGWTCPGVGQPQFRQPASVSRTGRRGEAVTNLTRTPQPRTSSVYTCSRTDVLPINSSYPPITLTANVDNNAAATVTNNVAVSGGGEVVTNNDTASDPTTITPGPDLTISKTHTGNFMQGQTGATYSISVSNVGGSPSVGTVTVADSLPSGLTATGIAGMGWTCTTSPLQCMRTDALANSSSYPAITLTVNVSTSAASPQNNTATVSGGGDVNPNNNSSTDSTTIVPGSDMTIMKSHIGSFLQGQTGATYTITASNSGIGPTVGIVTVSDMLPAGLTATAISGTGWNCTLGTLSCTRSDILGQGFSYPPITLTVTVAGNAPSSVTNMATVAGGGESNTSNDTASDITNIIPPADLTISKSHTGNFFQGQQGVTYTITVNNAGGSSTDGSQVLVSDTLPSGLTFVSMSGSGWTCPGVGQPQFRQPASVSRTGRRGEAVTNLTRTPQPRTSSVYTCSRTDVLPINSSYPPITLTANVDNNAASTVTNNVAVSGGGEINTSNDTASDPTTIAAGPDLTIAKTHTGNFLQGQTGATYSISVSNVGGSPSVGTVTVADTLPSGLTATAISGIGWTCTTSPLQCTRTDALGNSSSYPAITVTVSVSTSATSPQNNTATVSGGGDVNPNNNSSTDMTTIVPGSDMTITKSHSVQFFQGLNNVTYTLTATNSGVGPTVGAVTVTDTLPSGLTSVAISGTGWTCTLSTLSCTRSDVLAQGSSYPAITVTVNVALNAPSSVTNIATVAGGGESNTSNDSASDVTSINAGPDITIAKSHTGSFAQGQTGATYSITVSNIGGTASYGLVGVTDLLPTGLTATAISGTGWNCVLGTLSCERFDALSPNSSYPPITVTVNVSPTAPMPHVTNAANVLGGGDVNSTNNVVYDVTTIVPGADMTITKTHSVQFFQGLVGATYTITATNSGPGPTNGSTVTVTDTLPSGLTATAIGGTGWSCVLGTLTCTRSDVLASMSSYPAITLTVNVAANAPSSVTNVATVAGGGETNTSNDSASNITSINLGPDLTLAKVYNGSFRQGDAADTYSLTVTNGGGTASYGTVTVVDTLPMSGLTAIGLSGTGWSCNLGTLTCTRSDALNPSSSYPPITLTVSVASNAPTSVTNNASVSGGGEVITTNDSASAVTPIAQVADLTITKTHSGSFVEGQSGTYTITVSNLGPGPTVGTVTVTDTLPGGLLALSMSGSGWTCNTSTVSCTRSSVLASNASYPAITLTVLVGSAAASVTNVATVAGGGELNTSNDTATDPTAIIQTVQVTVTTSPANLTVVVDGSAVTGPHTFTWYVGSSHTLSTTTPQGGLNFQSWSDGGALTHNITAPANNSTYTATFH